jgi:60 kDa SS-A/Ro ribonucleoprotein
MRTNLKAPTIPAPRTHEGAVAVRVRPILELRRTVLCCLLWEDSFYESGVSVAQRITDLCATCDPDAIAALAVEARTAMKLRHVPLLLARELARRGVNVAGLLPQIIQRPDELTEFLALYWKDGKTPIAASVKRGLAVAFQRFSAYALAKYNRPDAIKLRDVLFLTHAKPKDDEQAATWKRLVDGTLPTPDTWEVALSAGGDKREAWTRLLTEGKLGALALLRNLRNMTDAQVDPAIVRAALRVRSPDRVLPFRFVSAARYAPSYEPELETLMFSCLTDRPRLPGKTVLLVDGSGSMFGTKVSAKSELDRFDAAAALAMLVRELCETVEVLVFSNSARLIPPRRGFALRDALYQAAERGGTQTEQAKMAADSVGYDRLIILTDEQSHTALSAPKGRGYVINVASYKNGIGYGPWTHIDGWSEAVVDFIQASEAAQATASD